MSSVSCNNPAFDNDTLQLQDNEHGSAQSQQLSLVVASPQQLDLTSGPLSQYNDRREITWNFRRKRPRTTALTGLTSTASTVSAALESTDRGEPQPRASITALG